MCDIDAGKPPILPRATLRWLCAGVLVLIVYGTLGPLGHGSRPWVTQVDAWRWLPERLHSDRNDVLTNLAVYIPVGIAFRLLVRKRGRAGRHDLLLGLTLSVLLSYTTEVLQQFMPARSSNLTDVYVNGFAALLGCLVAVHLQAALRRLHTLTFYRTRLRQGMWTAVAWLGVATAFLMMTWPWNLKHPSLTLGFDQPLGTSDPLWLGRMGAFAIVGFLAAGTSITRGRSRASAAQRTILRVALFTGALEVAQAVLGEHVSSMLQAVVATIGAAGGALLAARLVRSDAALARSPNDMPRPARDVHIGLRYPPASSRPIRRLAAVILIGTVLVAAGAAVLPGASLSSIRAEPVIQWAPFQGYYTAAFPRAMADALMQCLLFAFLTLLCLFLTQGRGRVAALLLLLGLVGVIEVCQAFLPGHSADTTSAVLATASWIVATRVWRSIYPDRPRAGAPPSRSPHRRPSVPPRLAQSMPISDAT